MHINSFTFLVPMTNFCLFDWLITILAILGIVIGSELLYHQHRLRGYVQIFASLLLPIFLYISVYSHHILENISTFSRISRYWRLLFPHDMSYVANFPWWLLFLLISYLAFFIFSGFSVYILIKHKRKTNAKPKNEDKANLKPENESKTRANIKPKNENKTKTNQKSKSSKKHSN